VITTFCDSYDQNTFNLNLECVLLDLALKEAWRVIANASCYIHERSAASYPFSARNDV